MNFTLDELEAEVRRIAAEDPGFIYTEQPLATDDGGSCSYLGQAIGERTGSPCIMGKALQALGFGEDDLELYESQGIHEILRDSHRATWGESRWFTVVQAEQDQGFSWGAVVESADEQSPRGGK